MAWTPPPEPVKWDLVPPVTFGSATYTGVTLRSPTAGNLLKATAVPGETGVSVTLRLISAISAEGIPFEAMLMVPSWQIEQMSNYFEMFNGAPLPGPLAERAAAALEDTISPDASTGAKAA